MVTGLDTHGIYHYLETKWTSYLLLYTLKKFGIFFIVYGGFRAARQYNQFKKMQREDNE